MVDFFTAHNKWRLFDLDLVMAESNHALGVQIA
eukprot:SAG11_NODE_34272_length_272_cov_109.537572_1_plen_32_part_10